MASLDMHGSWLYSVMDVASSKFKNISFLKEYSQQNNEAICTKWVGGVVVCILAFHAGGRGFGSHIRQS